MNSVTVEDLRRLPETISFPNEEEKVFDYWKKEKVFEACLKQSKGKPRYTFYDGPPFATGLPHYGHILAGTVKDIVTRYAHQQGYHVERRFGWDCHGLPVEYEIDKTLNIRGPEDVAKMGIKAYNNECRKIVMRYANEWEQIIGRMGRWIDFKNDYKTLYPWYMESIWWVFKQLYVKGLVYQGVKVMPYSTACTTSLSNFESGQNYKEVTDPAVFVSFPIVGDKDNVALVGWTTTPWTLPSNLACCVHPELIYARVKELKTCKVYIMMECRIDSMLKGPENFEILDRFPGSKLAGLKYEPLFDYFRKYENVAFRVLLDGYVTEDSGTGVVHQAPYFGEDDYRVCLANGVITRDQDIICPVDPSGKFMDPVTDFKGQYVKDADKNIIKLIKEKGRLVLVSQVKHNYPFCWRSDTPLIYKAVPSWFVRVEHMTKQLLNCSSQTYWVPEYVKEKRFGNWLRDARDWAISRNRYWGTPIPLWISPNGQEIVCIGSIEELEKYSGVRVEDLHRESIDHIEIPSAVPGNPPLRRIPEVFDCWFESGSMPFAQNHYPFENASDFLSNSFPADFIAEGIDQTRGWFYTLLVISTALFNKPPFKNLNCTGLVLAGDGQKMSKRKKNYPDPMEVVNKYGADALRLYLINSPVVRAENLRFKEEGVKDIIKDVFLPWYNAFRFLLQNVDRFEKEEKIVYRYDAVRHAENRSTNVMDVWITSFKESLLDFVSKEMKAYHLYTVVPRLTKFIDQLTNWYVRMNRKRIKGEFGVEDCYHALDTLYDVLFAMVKMMAPFTPYLTEYMFQRLRLLNKEQIDGSVHFQMMPESNKKYINVPIERAVSRMQAVVELGRVMRDRRTVPIKYPLTEVIVTHQSKEYLDDIKSLENFILDELNVRKITMSSDKQKYGVKLRAEPDHKVLGMRLKNDFKQVIQAVKALTDEQITEQVKLGHFTVLGHRIELNELRLIYQFDEQKSEGHNYEAHSDNDVLALLDMTPNEELMKEGVAREIINRIQKLKKKAKLIPTDPVLIYYTVSKDGEIKSVAESHQEFIVNTVKSPFLPYGPEAVSKQVLIEESQELKGVQLNIAICSPKDRQIPASPWLNLVLDEKITPRYQSKPSQEATVLLTNVKGDLLNLNQLNHEIHSLFGLNDQFYRLLTADGKELERVDLKLNQQTVFITRETTLPNGWKPAKAPCCAFRNVEYKGRKSTVLEENPVGVKLDVEQVMKRLFPDAKQLKEEGVKDIIKDVFLPWYNAFRFLLQNVDRFEKEEKLVYRYDAVRHAENRSTNVMDVWITSFKESLLDFVSKEMKAYHLYTVVPRLTQFIDQLTNWYVRMNRKRIKGEFGVEDCYHALDTLYDVLFAMVKMMAPFTPYLTEYMFQRLRLLNKEQIDGSVHFQMMPESNKKYINVPIERAVSRMQAVVELGRVMRDRRTVPIKYPLTEVIVTHQSKEYLDVIKSLENFILDELNVRKITMSSDKQKYGVKLRAEPDHKVLGMRLKNDFKQVIQAVKALTDEQITEQVKLGHFTVLGHRIELNELRLIYQFDEQKSEGHNYEAHSDNDVLALLDMTPNEELMKEGVAREIINRIQKLKKKAKLIPTDPVLIYYTVSKDGEIKSVAESHQEFIVNTVKSPFLPYGPEAVSKQVLIEESQELKGVQLNIAICSPKDRQIPASPWLNLVLDEKITPRYQSKPSQEATVLLTNVKGDLLNLNQLNHEIHSLFGLNDQFYRLLTADGKELERVDLKLNQQTVFITRETTLPNGWKPAKAPCCAFRNVEYKGRKATVLEENPVGVKLDVEQVMKRLFPDAKQLKVN